MNVRLALVTLGALLSCAKPAPGPTGPAGVSVTMAVLPAGSAACPEGGVALTAGDGTVANVCNGARGMGVDTAVTATAIPAGDAACPAGGVRLSVGTTQLPVCSGAAGTPGTNGMNGTNGTNGTNGADGAPGAPGSNGMNGMNGASVTLTALAPGDSTCPLGGTRLNVGSSVGYACSARLAPYATGWFAELFVGTTSYGRFDDVSLASLVTAVEVTTPQGTRVAPGNTSLEAVFQGPVTSNLLPWSWREAVASGGPGFVRNVEVRIADASNRVIVTYTLTNAWPRKLSYPQLGLVAAGPRYTLELVATGLTRTQPATPTAMNPAPAGALTWLVRRNSTTPVVFTNVDGLHTGNAVITQNTGTTVIQLPGRLDLAHVTARRPLDADPEMWTWHEAVRAGLANAARSSLDVVGPDLNLRLLSTMPYEYTVTLGRDGVPQESVMFVAESIARVP